MHTKIPIGLGRPLCHADILSLNPSSFPTHGSFHSNITPSSSIERLFLSSFAYTY